VNKPPELTRAIIIRELNRLRRFSYSLTGSKADADDLVQNVVERLLKKGIPDRENPVPWMLTVCKNMWIDEMRARDVRLKYASEKDRHNNEQSGSDARMSEPLLNQLETDRVLSALAKLPENHRLPLGLVAVGGMSYAEVAYILDVPIGTVMSRVARARASLVKLFDEQ
jgi:RNA polymerase sigma-70 factor (ECF subfamily)